MVMREVSIILISAVLLAVTSAAMAQDTTKEINKYYWNLGDLYPSDSAWEIAYLHSEERVNNLESLKGTLGKSAQSMLHGMTEISNTSKEAARLYVFAELRFYEDQRISDSQELLGRARGLLANLEKATAWVDPEILAIGDHNIETFLAQKASLSAFEFQIRDMIRRRPYILTEEGEDIVAKASLFSESPFQIYTLYRSDSIPWPTISLADGRSVHLTTTEYNRHRSSTNRTDRKAVFDAYWSKWSEYESGLGATLTAEIQSNVFQARARKFDSVLQQNMFDDAIPDEIYGTLIEQVNSALPIFHRYLSLRANLLDVDDLAYYDIYAPLVDADTGVFDIERTKRITLEALRPFGDTYLSLLEDGMKKDWMHSHPKEGKNSLAQVTGWAYDVHPYILLNHNDDYESLTTFAHEWGHAVHNVLSTQSNPWETYDFSTFLAEMASTINEILLQEYMIENAATKEEKILYLGNALESVRATVFRQTMFAEFELAIHEATERGESLTGDNLSKRYLSLLRKYHGEADGVMEIDELYGIEWAYIPHFYFDFYLYQYATSMSGAVWFAEQFLSGDEEVRESFIRVLSAGGSDYPHNILLNEAGLDMRKPDAYQAAFQRMENLMDRIEDLLDD